MGWLALAGSLCVACGGGAPPSDVGARDAHVVPLRFEAMPSGRGRVGSAQGWVVRLEFQAPEGGCPGLPLHVQVKLGRRTLLRQNVWFRPRGVELRVERGLAWLVLTGTRQVVAIPLGHEATTRRRALPGRERHELSDNRPCE